MANRNYVKGRNAEYRRLKEVSNEKGFIRGERFFASRGRTDIWYIIDGIYHEEQIKYSSKGYLKISMEEFLTLLEYAMEYEGKRHIKLTTGAARKPFLVWKLN